MDRKYACAPASLPFSPLWRIKSKPPQQGGSPAVRFRVRVPTHVPSTCTRELGSEERQEGRKRGKELGRKQEGEGHCNLNAAHAWPYYLHAALERCIGVMPSTDAPPKV